MEYKRKLKPWKILVKTPFMNCEKVHPLQQKKVDFILSQLKNDESIEKVILFGSSITHRCHVGSDIDLYIEKTSESKILLDKKEYLIDIWTNFTVDKRLKEEIYRTGIVIYEKDILNNSVSVK